MLELVLQDIEPAASNQLEELKVGFDVFQRRVPGVRTLLIRDQELWCRFADEIRRYQSANEIVRDKPNENGDQHGDKSNDDRCGPFWAIQRLHGESLATDEYNENLGAADNKLDADEEKVALYAFKDVELVVQPASVVLIEDLHPHESIEDE